ncbi:glutathione S-transferase family protein [Providencia alcalifaciens]|uniref:glutathione S-transferase family protein n=1 Tax=unclassified Providencia TaxID=2633465 RepID=UPI0034E7DD3B
MLKILGRTSSINVRKVLWTAHELNLEFIHEDQWGNTESLKQLNYLKLNPNALIPVLIHDQGALWESNTICRYLAATTQHENILPTDPLARAEVEKWMDWQSAELNPAWRAAFMALIRRDPFYLQHYELVESSIVLWNEKMLILDSVLAQNKTTKNHYDYLCGEYFTLADIVVTLSIQRWLLTPLNRLNTPFLIDYYHRMINRPAALKCIDPSTA